IRNAHLVSYFKISSTLQLCCSELQNKQSKQQILQSLVLNTFGGNMFSKSHRQNQTEHLLKQSQTPLYASSLLLYSMTVVMKTQARWELMERTDVFYVGISLIVTGTVLVVSSFLALGFTGTFLGDYFGILMDEKVTGFPFSVVENPMYWGSTANYLGLALIGASPVGLVLTAIVALAYKVAIRFEGPFTEQIYLQRNQRRKQE
uniref:Phosphatidylethanolamine N-methyltransferase n=2 Tax=Poecilia mexicana TaxID=48701 RepID=A0A3B3XQJ4_9TELE